MVGRVVGHQVVVGHLVEVEAVGWSVVVALVGGGLVEGALVGVTLEALVVAWG